MVPIVTPLADDASVRAAQLRTLLVLQEGRSGGVRQVVQAVIDSVLCDGRAARNNLELDLADPKVSAIHTEWDNAADRDEETRAYFSSPVTALYASSGTPSSST